MDCPACDKPFVGEACSCGWRSLAAPATAGAPKRTSRPWKYCEWTTAHGTCGAPTGTVSPGREHGPFAAPRLCAWHRDRELLSLASLKMSERQAFDDWLTRFPAGTSYQPFPGIWDKDSELLWLLVTGAVPFVELEAQLMKRLAAC